jgi:hypothetical protein
MQVWLIYEDDYGGLFSPYVLIKVCKSEQEANEYCKGNCLTRIVQSGYNGDGIENYPYYHGGLFSDD